MANPTVPFNPNSYRIPPTPGSTCTQSATSHLAVRTDSANPFKFKSQASDERLLVNAQARQPGSSSRSYALPRPETCGSATWYNHPATATTRAICQRTTSMSYFQKHCKVQLSRPWVAGRRSYFSNAEVEPTGCPRVRKVGDEGSGGSRIEGDDGRLADLAGQPLVVCDRPP